MINRAHGFTRQSSTISVTDIVVLMNEAFTGKGNAAMS